MITLFTTHRLLHLACARSSLTLLARSGCENGRLAGVPPNRFGQSAPSSTPRRTSRSPTRPLPPSPPANLGRAARLRSCCADTSCSGSLARHPCLPAPRPPPLASCSLEVRLLRRWWRQRPHARFSASAYWSPQAALSGSWRANRGCCHRYGIRRTTPPHFVMQRTRFTCRLIKNS